MHNGYYCKILFSVRYLLKLLNFHRKCLCRKKKLSSVARSEKYEKSHVSVQNS